MVKVRISYQYPEELPPILAALDPLIDRMRYSEQKGQFMRLYIDIKRTFETEITVEATEETLTPTP